MSISYSAGGGTRDTIRLLIGETNPNDTTPGYRLEDEEIDALIALDGSGYSVKRLAARAARMLAIKLARKPEGVIGSNAARPLDRSARLNTLANDLERQANSEVAPYMGGLTIASREAAAARIGVDRPQPAFYRGMLDLP